MSGTRNMGQLPWTEKSCLWCRHFRSFYLPPGDPRTPRIAADRCVRTKLTKENAPVWFCHMTRCRPPRGKEPVPTQLPQREFYFQLYDLEPCGLHFEWEGYSSKLTDEELGRRALLTMASVPGGAGDD